MKHKGVKFLKLKKGILLFCCLFPFFAFAQNERIVDQPFFALPAYEETTSRTIDSLSELPSKIRFIATEVIKRSMGDFAANVTFAQGQEIDLENWLPKDSTTQIEYRYSIPKYELFFELSDSLLSIRKYCFSLSMDSYGQVLRMEWPREGYSARAALKKPVKIYETAVSYAKKKHYKTSVYLWELTYEYDLNALYWHVSFLQKARGDKYKFRKEYKTIVLDALSGEVVEELDTVSTATD